MRLTMASNAGGKTSSKDFNASESYDGEGVASPGFHGGGGRVFSTDFVVTLNILIAASTSRDDDCTVSRKVDGENRVRMLIVLLKGAASSVC